MCSQLVVFTEQNDHTTGRLLDPIPEVQPGFQADLPLLSGYFAGFLCATAGELNSLSEP